MLKFSSEDDFEAFMLDVESERERAGLPIDPLASFGVISRRYPDVEFDITEAMRTPVVGLEGHALTRRMIDWLERRFAVEQAKTKSLH